MDVEQLKVKTCIWSGIQLPCQMSKLFKIYMKSQRLLLPNAKWRGYCLLHMGVRIKWGEVYEPEQSNRLKLLLTIWSRSMNIQKLPRINKHWRVNQLPWSSSFPVEWIIYPTSSQTRYHILDTQNSSFVLSKRCSVPTVRSHTQLWILRPLQTSHKRLLSFILPAVLLGLNQTCRLHEVPNYGSSIKIATWPVSLLLFCTELCSAGNFPLALLYILHCKPSK